MKKAKVLLLFRSKYGATKKYADLFERKRESDIVNLANHPTIALDNYDIVVLAGGIYAGGIAGMDFLKKHYEKLKDKKLAILCVGASPYEEKALDEMKEKNLKGDMKNIPVFYARGAWDESKMTLKDKVLCKMLHRYIKKKDPSTYEPWMKAFAESLGKQCDWVEEEYLNPLLQFIEE